MLGNPDAPLKIIMVSNLYCNPCKEKHKVIEQLIAMYPDKVSVTLRFVPSGNYRVGKLTSLSYLLGSWLSHVHGKTDEQEKTVGLMHDWFASLDLQKFAKQWPIDETQQGEFIRIEEYHHKWVEGINLTLTPTFFINGNELPKEYSIDDLLAMVSGLVDSVVKVNTREVALQDA